MVTKASSVARLLKASNVDLSTYMGDHQEGPSASDLGPFVVVDILNCDRPTLNSLDATRAVK